VGRVVEGVVGVAEAGVGAAASSRGRAMASLFVPLPEVDYGDVVGLGVAVHLKHVRVADRPERRGRGIGIGNRSRRDTRTRNRRLSRLVGGATGTLCRHGDRPTRLIGRHPPRWHGEVVPQIAR
jgi:hypothetical protein